jgi:hypothetical protein
MGRYRKTGRRQRRHPVWSPRPQGRRTIVWPVPPTGDITATFLLPGELSLIALGQHGVAVAVTPAGLVQIAGSARAHRRASERASAHSARVALDPRRFKYRVNRMELTK